MDDKEKEKFGVVIDKDKEQSSGEQPESEKNPSENQNLTSDDEKKEIIETKEDELEKTSAESSNESQIETTQSTNENENVESNEEENKEHEVIHKKDGRLHIYVRQDKYKGELKSKNWVGRLYIDGKQKISSSGTPNLDDAIPILEKWFDDIHAQKEKEKEQKSLEQTSTTQETTTPQQTSETEVKTVNPTEVAEKIVTPAKEVAVESQKIITEEKKNKYSFKFIR